jgi:transcription termination factor Rho
MVSAANLGAAQRLVTERRAAVALAEALMRGARVAVSVVEASGKQHAVAVNQEAMVPRIAADVAGRITEIDRDLAAMGVEP